MLMVRALALHSLFFGLMFFSSGIAEAEATTLYQSVEQALNYSPQLQSLVHSREAVQFDLQQSQARKLSKIDVLLGYGIEQYSDDVTRRPAADPADSDWNPRAEATLRLVQNLYDGGEIAQQVSVREAQLAAALLQVRSAAQTLALNAVGAHLGVYKQLKLVALAEKNLAAQTEIYHLMFAREQAGTGNVAEVTQVQSRMARARTVLYSSQAELTKANANYKRIVGEAPQHLTFAGIPDETPASLAESLGKLAIGNPELGAFKARVAEAAAKVSLERSKYQPKIDIQLSSTYYDQMAGDRSWQNTNAAMLKMRWNIFNGGQDKAQENAALARKYQSKSKLVEKNYELQEAVTSAWVSYTSLGEQINAYRQATDAGRQTFAAYLDQFKVSQRSLLDLLGVENEYFQSASQLVSGVIDEVFAAYRLLALGGELRIAKGEGTKPPLEELEPMSLPEILSFIDPVPSRPLSANSGTVGLQKVKPDNSGAIPTASVKTASADNTPQLYTLTVAPSKDSEKALEIIGKFKQQAESTSMAGKVQYIRLLEGEYPAAEARKRLATLKKNFDSAFIIPGNGSFALYLGSYRNSKLAIHQTELLRRKKINVVRVAADIEKKRTVLVVRQMNIQVAEKMLTQMKSIGLIAKLSKDALLKDTSPL